MMVLMELRLAFRTFIGRGGTPFAGRVGEQVQRATTSELLADWERMTDQPITR